MLHGRIRFVAEGSWHFAPALTAARPQMAASPTGTSFTVSLLCQCMGEPYAECLVRVQELINSGFLVGLRNKTLGTPVSGAASLQVSSDRYPAFLLCDKWVAGLVQARP